MVFDFEFSFPALIRLKIKPAIIGKIIIFIISSIIFQISTDTYCPPITFIRKGVTKGEIIVVMAPIVTARARLALASRDITLEANPLGTQPISIIPADISGGKLKTLVMTKAIKGINK